MSDITVRYVQTRRGDTLQEISLRELGDAGRWAELIWLNDLLPPFITDDPLLAGPRVILTGNVVALYASATGVTLDELETFGVDVALDASGALVAQGGDFAVEAGFPNLKVALVRRLMTEKRSRGFTPEYGCWVRLLLGERLGPAQMALAALYVESALLEDDRVAAVPSCVATADGDVIRIRVSVTPIDGKDLNFEVTI